MYTVCSVYKIHGQFLWTSKSHFIHSLFAFTESWYFFFLYFVCVSKCGEKYFEISWAFRWYRMHKGISFTWTWKGEISIALYTSALQCVFVTFFVKVQTLLIEKVFNEREKRHKLHLIPFLLYVEINALPFWCEFFLLLFIRLNLRLHSQREREKDRVHQWTKSIR